MAASTLIDRRNGIPGSDAEKQIKRMGGPIARRASRTPADGPAPMSFGRNRCAHPDAQEESPAPDVLPETEEDDEEDEWQQSRPRARDGLLQNGARPGVLSRLTAGGPMISPGLADICTVA